MGLPRRISSALRPVHEAPSALPDDRTCAVTELFQVHYAQLVRLARFLVDDKETAEDVVMDAFTALFRRWATIRDVNEAYGYLRSSVVNGARSQLRRRKVVRLHVVTSDVTPAGPDIAAAGSARATVMGLLHTLPRRQREVLVLRYFLDLSEAEIAETLQISPGSVKTHAARGLSALAHALEAAR